MSTQPATITLNVRTPSGAQFQVDVAPSDTLAVLRQKVAEKSSVPADQQRLIFSGRILRDEAATLESAGISKPGQTLILVKSASAPAAQPAPAPAPQPAATAAASAAPGAGAAPFNLFGLPPLMQGGLDMQQMQAQLMANPELMRQMMDSPMVQQMMQNPDLLRAAIDSNPAMRDVIARNPEVGHMLNDPAVLRQAMQMARNPELMRETMRHTDRAMSNLEAHPEGFNALRRMYTNVQEPLLEAAQQQQQQQQAANPFAALFGSRQPAAGASSSSSSSAASSSASSSATPEPNSAPLPNPWAPPAAAGTAPRPTAAAATAAAPGPFMPGAGGDLAAMLSNPAVQQMMQQVFADPRMSEQLRGVLQQTAAGNPQLQPLLSNPDLMRQLADPRTLQAMVQMQQAISQLQDVGILPPGMGGMGFPGAAPLVPPPGFAMPGAAQPAAGNTLPPEQRYATQLQQLRDMGFYDQQAALNALVASNGSVQLAIERLLGGSGM